MVSLPVTVYCIFYWHILSDVFYQPTSCSLFSSRPNGALVLQARRPGKWQKITDLKESHICSETISAWLTGSFEFVGGPKFWYWCSDYDGVWVLTDIMRVRMSGGYGDRWDHCTEVSSLCNRRRNVASRHAEEASSIRPRCTVFSWLNSTFYACFHHDPDTNESSSSRLRAVSRQFWCSRQ